MKQFPLTINKILKQNTINQPIYLSGSSILFLHGLLSSQLLVSIKVSCVFFIIQFNCVYKIDDYYQIFKFSSSWPFGPQQQSCLWQLASALSQDCPLGDDPK